MYIFISIFVSIHISPKLYMQILNCNFDNY